MVVDHGTQMTPCPCVWLKFAFYPFFAHEGNRVLLLAKKLDQPSTISPSHATNKFQWRNPPMGKLLTPIGPS